MDDKKDITGLFEFTQSENEKEPSISLDTPSSPALDQFESFEDFSKKEPTIEQSEPVVFTPAEQQPATEPLMAASSEFQPPEFKSEPPTFTPPPEASNVPAAYPFTLEIQGHLSALDQEKFLDLMQEQSMGFRRPDLEPMLEAGHIKLPRISEYAAILIVQKLRDANVEFTLTPTQQGEEELQDHSTFASRSDQNTILTEPMPHPAELIPVTTGAHFPDSAYWTVVDTLVASTLLKAVFVESKNSSDYSRSVEALKNELRYKAHHLGANGIIQFSIQLTPLSDSASYRLTATATAVHTLKSPLSEPVITSSAIDTDTKTESEQ
mgnify:CR=1 FL=1